MTDTSYSEITQQEQAIAILEIEEGQRLRGWITNSYAQIEFLLGDLILRCRVYSEYSDCTASLPHGAPDRVKRVRRMLAVPGPISLFADDLTGIIDRFENRHETRNLLAHGFCEYLVTPQGDSGLKFQKWHRSPTRQDARLIRCFRLADLQAEKESFTTLATEAMRLFYQIHDHCGWVARPDMVPDGE